MEATHLQPDRLSIRISIQTSALMSVAQYLRTEHLSRCQYLSLFVGLVRIIALVLLVYSYDCNGTNAQKWLINRGNTKVQVAGTHFCLEAGSSMSSLSSLQF